MKETYRPIPDVSVQGCLRDVSCEMLSQIQSSLVRCLLEESVSFIGQSLAGTNEPGARGASERTHLSECHAGTGVGKQTESRVQPTG